MMKNRLALLIISTIGVTGFLSQMLVIPALPWMIEPLGANSESISLIISVANFPGIFILPFFGYLVDRIGRKVLLVSNLLIFSVAGISIAFAPSLLIAVILRLIQGAAGAILYPMTAILIGDLYFGTERKQATGIVSSVGSAAGIIGPLFSGVLASIDWRISFLAFGIGFLPMFLVIKFLDLPQPSTASNASENLSDVLSSIKQGLAFLKTQHLGFIFGAGLLLYGLDAAIMFTYYPIFVQQVFGVSQIEIGFAMTCLFAASTVTSLAYSWINPYLSTRSMGLTAFILYGVGILTLPFQPTYYATLVSVIITGSGFGIVMPLLINEILDFTPEHLRGTETSLYYAIRRGGQTVVPLLFAGVLAFTQSLSGLFILAGFLVVFLIGIYLLDGANQQRHKAPDNNIPLTSQTTK